VLNAVNASAAGGGDIVLVRPGNYNKEITINKPVTLRATRAGGATIGKP
jgi:nitrous oxidase accessory protein NosD